MGAIFFTVKRSPAWAIRTVYVRKAEVLAIINFSLNVSLVSEIRGIWRNFNFFGPESEQK